MVIKWIKTDSNKEIQQLEGVLKGLNKQNSNITNVWNQDLRSHAAGLRSVDSEFRRIQQVKQQLQSIAYMSTELGTDVFEKEKPTARMRASLIWYIMDNCGDNQIIVAENEFPENVDYTKIHQLE